MIEIRIVEHELGTRTEIQYRFALFPADASGSLCVPYMNNMWSNWRTAEWVRAEDIENE